MGLYQSVGARLYVIFEAYWFGILINSFSPVPRAKGPYGPKDEQEAGVPWMLEGPPDPFGVTGAGLWKRLGFGVRQLMLSHW